MVVRRISGHSRSRAVLCVSLNGGNEIAEGDLKYYLFRDFFFPLHRNSLKYLPRFMNDLLVFTWDVRKLTRIRSCYITGWHSKINDHEIIILQSKHLPDD